MLYIKKILTILIFVFLFLTFIKPTYAQGTHCQSCGATNPCDSLYACIQGYCIPNITDGQAGSECLNRSQCDNSKNLVCTGGQNADAYCAAYASASLPGRCVDQATVPQPPPPGGGNAPANTDYFCDGNTGIDTALGCVPIEDPNDIAAFFLRWGLGIVGGLAILLIIVASFIIMTSSGDPKKIQGGKELLTAALSGLVLIIFSVFILRLIGVNILGIF